LQTDHVTNGEVLRRVGLERGLLGQVKSRKLKYFGHAMRHNGLEKDIMLGMRARGDREGKESSTYNTVDGEGPIRI